MTDREEQLRLMILQTLERLPKLRDVPFYKVIEAITGSYTVWPYDGHALEDLERIADLSMADINAEGVKAKRPNEAGNESEPFVINAINRVGGMARQPLTESGKRKVMGYPDIEACIQNKPFYIEVKTYNENKKLSSERSFYTSPSREYKVTKNAYHLIFSFCMEVVGQSGEERIYKAKSCTIVDAYNLLCNVKFEINSNNKRMYGNPEMIVFSKDYEP